MAQKRKPGARENFHLTGWGLERMREESAASGRTYGEIVSDILERWASEVDFLNVGRSEITKSKGVRVRLSPRSKRMLDDMAEITGMRPASVLNVLLLWNYLTNPDPSSDTGGVTKPVSE